MDYISTDFRVSSSYLFLFTARTDTRIQTDTQMITLPTPRLTAGVGT